MKARLLACVALGLGCGADTALCTPDLSTDLAIDETVTATAAEVQPILARSCAVGGCHLRAPGAGGLVLDVASATWPRALVGVRSQATPAMELVAAGQPARSWLIAKLDGAFCGATCDPALGCGGAMPPGEPLADAERAILVAWIRGGAR